MSIRSTGSCLGTESSLAPHKEKHNILTSRIKAVDSPEASRCCADVGSEDDSNGIALGQKTAGWVEATEPAHRGRVWQATIENLHVVKHAVGVVLQAEVGETQLESYTITSF